MECIVYNRYLFICRRQIGQFQAMKHIEMGQGDTFENNVTISNAITKIPVKICKNCQNNYDDELSKCSKCMIKQACNFCEPCQQELKVFYPIFIKLFLNKYLLQICPDDEGNAMQLAELEANYSIVVDENENLRIGMHQILEKLRTYDGIYALECISRKLSYY